MFIIGPRARIFGLRSELSIALTVITSICLEHGVSVELSHGPDGKHTRASIHYSGGAVDLLIGLRPSDPKVDKTQLTEQLRLALGQDFDIVHEEPGKPNEHHHIEFQPKEPY